MVYCFASTPPEDFLVATEDRNSGKSLGDLDEVSCDAYSGCNLGDTENSLSITKPMLIIVELEEGQGN